MIRSELSGVKVGDHVYGILREFLKLLYIANCGKSIPILINVYTPLEAFQNYFIKDNLDYLRVLENPYSLPWSTFLGVLGMPGKSSGYGSVKITC